MRRSPLGLGWAIGSGLVASRDSWHESWDHDQSEWLMTLQPGVTEPVASKHLTNLVKYYLVRIRNLSCNQINYTCAAAINYLRNTFSHTFTQVYISKSKKEFHRSTFQDSKARKRAQDVSTAKSAIKETTGSAVVWLPSVLGTVALAATHGNTSILSEIGTWTSHSIYWVSPLLCLLNNTALRRALVCLKMDVAKVLRRAQN